MRPFSHSLRNSLLLLSGLVFLACSSESSSQQGAGAPGSASGGSASGGSASGGDQSTGGQNSGGAMGGVTMESSPEVTFYEDVAPILYAECSSCHYDEGVTPIALVDYETLVPLSSILAGVVDNHQMPPMPVDSGGDCNSYENARHLSETEIAAFRAWAEGGALEGDVSQAPAVPQKPEDMQAPDATLDLGFEYTPTGESFFEYRCFLLESPIAEERYLTEYQLRASERRNLHHLVVYQPTSDEAATEARALSEADPGQGYSCFGGAGVSAEPIAVWNPDRDRVQLPQNTGIKISAGRDLIVQVQLNLTGGAQATRPRIDLRLVSDGVTEAGFFAVEDEKLSLAPGEESVETSAQVQLSINEARKVYGVFPLMLDMGESLRVEFQSGDESRCMVQVRDWRFAWQNAWWYDRPLDFETIDSATITCAYDTRNREEVTTRGEGIDNEICKSYFYMDR